MAITTPTQDTIDRFWAKVDKSGECWLWTGYRKHNGYGIITVEGNVVAAQRLSWILAYGHITPGKRILQTCGNHHCVRPEHLYILPHSDESDAEKLVRHFWKHVQRGNGCWLWTGPKVGMGYGKFSVRGKYYRAHRVSWELVNGPIPSGLIVCHKCDVPACVRPDHLFLGTFNDNNKDLARKGHAARGERNAHAKLTEEQVIEIRQRYKNGESGTTLAREFGVDPSNIWLIGTGRRWRHVSTGVQA